MGKVIMKTIKRTALIAASVAFVGTAVMAPSAMAASSPASRMLTKADVPAIFGTPKNYEFTNKIDKFNKVISPCTTAANKALYSQPASKVQYWADSETKSGKAYTDVNERVYQYPTEADATAAFTALSQGVTACTGTTSAVIDGSKIRNTYTNGTFAGGAYKSVWVQQQSFNAVVGDKTRQANTATLTAYSTSGNAVIATWVYINPQTYFPPAETAAVQKLAMDLSAKWVK